MGFKAARESKNLTQQQAAEIFQVKRSTVAMWETGKSVPRAELLPLIARTYNCEIGELLEPAS